MHYLVIFLALWLASATNQAGIAAPYQDYVGRWLNVDARTRGVTSLTISVKDGSVVVAGFGACVPRDCAIPPAVYTHYVSSGESDTAGVLVHVGNSTLTTLRLRSADELEQEDFTEYRDRSGRPNAHFTFHLRRAK